MHFLRLHGSDFLVEATNTLIDMYLDTVIVVVDQPINLNFLVCVLSQVVVLVRIKYYVP